MSNINATSISFIDLFTKEGDIEFRKKYVSDRVEIPSFQRNYAWEIKHIREFLESIIEYPTGYYIGNILIQKSNWNLVVDGQQRLTTIFLILAALKELGISNKNKNLADEIIFANKAKKVPRINFTRENLNSSFISIMESGFSEEDFTDENSKKFFKNFNFLKKYISSVDNKNDLFNKVINLTFVVIGFEKEFDVNQLFEGLNSKGKPLSPIQLTKNALIGSTKDGSDTERVIDIWEEIESSYELNKKITWFDKFLRHLGFYNFGYVSSGELFKKIKSDIKKQDNVLSFSMSFQKDSDLYVKIRMAQLVKTDINSDFSESDWLTTIQLIKHLSVSDLEQVYGVLFASIKCAQINKEYRSGKNSRFLRDIKRIWAFSILAKFLDLKPSLFETDFAVFANNLSKSSYKNSQSLFKKLIEIVSNTNESLFTKNLNNRIRFTGDINKKVTSKNHSLFISLLLLFYLEDGKKFITESCSIEHIIPKGKKDGLQLWENIGKRYLDDVKNIARYKLGNLTLLRDDKAGNLSFNEKLAVYKIEKSFKKNSYLKKYQTLFNSSNPGDAVEKRGKEIGSSIYKNLVNILENDIK